ncbi:MAG: sigma-70 family RNA polymerase sigma factor [Verrucomicrobiaceae bacterium]|nr:sigma-70 family RNA polymerase sigma factor [Verrucomicrobiaceae bacterium]
MLTDEQQERFTRLWTEVQPSVSGYIHAVVRDSVVAKDIVQETALALLRKFADWDQVRDFLPWALGAAKYEILAHRRDSARCRVTFDDEVLHAITETWSSVAPEISDEQAALHSCLDKLAPHARDVVRLRYDEDWDAPQIAQKLHSTAGAVRVALMRIREQLRDCVQHQLTLEGGLS